jgi:hypothetical protein
MAALDLLMALLARGPVVSVDTRTPPVEVTVWREETGARRFYGESVASALSQALAATTPRAAKEED